MAEDFQMKYSFDQRKNESLRIRQKYPDRIPIIVEKGKTSDIQTIDKCKFLVSKDLTVGQFLFVIRKRIELSPEKSIYIYMNNTIPSNSSLLNSVYDEHKNEDGFLYCYYCGETVFGN